jgi:hypothetical protein
VFEIVTNPRRIELYCIRRYDPALGGPSASFEKLEPAVRSVKYQDDAEMHNVNQHPCFREHFRLLNVSQYKEDEVTPWGGTDQAAVEHAITLLARNLGVDRTHVLCWGRNFQPSNSGHVAAEPRLLLELPIVPSLSEYSELPQATVNFLIGKKNHGNFARIFLH